MRSLLIKILSGFIIISLFELYLLVLLARHTGFWFTLGITFVFSAIGSYLARREGMKAYAQFRAAFSIPC